jgi:hypothetical protein
MENLGHMIYPSGLGVHKAKVEAISQVPQPIDVSWLRAFLGLCNYYWSFVKGFGSIIRPLTWLTHIDQEIIWDEAKEQAFQEL